MLLFMVLAVCGSSTYCYHHVGGTLGCKRFYCVNVFQGGYNLTSLAQSVCQTVQTLLGDPAPRPANLDDPCRRSVSHRQSDLCAKLYRVCVCL